MLRKTLQGGVEILLVDSCCRNRDKLRPDGPLVSYAELIFFYTMIKKNVFFFFTVFYQYSIIIVVAGLVFPLKSTGFLATEVTIVTIMVFCF